MKNIFQKSHFPKASGGNLYQWKSAETAFEVAKDGLYTVRIDALAKDAQQNKGADDDDLRVALDGFDFGKYEQSEGSWKGFNVSASWNGATLKGDTKTVYFFVNLNKGRHTLQFFADETPSLKNIEVYEISGHSFELSRLTPPEKIKSGRNGIPWLSFVFLGVPSKNVTLGVNTKSAKSKGGTDGDNLKVVVNGRILQSVQAPASDKYKNFYFSGDLKEFDVLTITDEELAKPLAFENAVELWYDEEPEIMSLKIKFFDEEEFFRKYDLESSRNWLRGQIRALCFPLETSGRVYTAEFLRHSLTENPSPLIYKSSDPISKKIKTDPTYGKICEKLKEKITSGNLNGEIWPADFKGDPDMGGDINFSSFDLKTSLHGIRKVEYSATKTKNNTFSVELTLFDIYDFERKKPPTFLSDCGQFLTQAIVNRLDLSEELGIINDFEIEIYLKETL